MRKRFWLTTALSLCLGLLAQAQTLYILELKPGTNVNALASQFQFTILKSWTSSTQSGYKISTTETSTAIAALRAQPGVLDLEPDATLSEPESDPKSKAKATLQSLGSYAFDRTTVTYYGATVRNGYVNQPATQLIELAAGHQIASTGNSTVAIIDTGADPNHPALSQSLLTGYDFTRDRPGANELDDLDQSTVAILDQSTVAILDGVLYPVTLGQSTVAILDQSTVAILDTTKLPKSFGHGTMVAGLVHLVAPGARILPLKAFHSDGTANLSDIVQAIRYAADNHANIIVMSFTFDALSPDLEAAITYATGKGVICVAAAGNDGPGKTYYPAAIRGVIGVGSTNFSDHRSPFSNTEPSANMAAPGEALVTTYPGGNYAAAWGTSFSAPLVAGAIALMQQIRPHGGEFRDALEAGVQIDQDMGDARLDILKSLNYCFVSH